MVLYLDIGDQPAYSPNPKLTTYKERLKNFTDLTQQAVCSKWSIITIGVNEFVDTTPISMKVHDDIIGQIKRNMWLSIRFCSNEIEYVSDRICRVY